VTRRDDDFLARVEPFAEPRGGGPEHGSSRYAEGLRRAKAERRASLESGVAGQVHNKRREAMHKAYVVGAGVMGAAVVAAAAVAVLVFTGVIAVSPGTSGGDRRAEALGQQPSSTTTTPPSSPSTTTGPPSLSTAAESGPSPLRPSHPVATPDTTAGEQVPARPSSNSGGSARLSSASSPPPSGAPAPGAPTARALSGDDRTDRRHHGRQLPQAQPHTTTAVSNEPRHS
jgi:hypothetical protein